VSIFDQIFKPNIAKLFSRCDVVNLTRALRHQDSQVRIAAIQALAKLGREASKESVPILISLVVKSDNPDGQEAAEILPDLVGPEVKNELLEAFEKHQLSRRQRLLLSQALLRVGEKAPASKYLEELDHNDVDIVQAAAMALGKVGDQRAIPRLISLLDGPTKSPGFQQNDFIRRTAAISLCQLKDASAIPTLIKLLSRTDAFQGDHILRVAVLHGFARFQNKSIVVEITKHLRRSNISAFDALAGLHTLVQLGALKHIEIEPVFNMLLNIVTEMFIEETASESLGNMDFTAFLKSKIVDDQPFSRAARRILSLLPSEPTNAPPYRYKESKYNRSLSIGQLNNTIQNLIQKENISQRRARGLAFIMLRSWSQNEIHAIEVAFELLEELRA